MEKRKKWERRDLKEESTSIAIILLVGCEYQLAGTRGSNEFI